MKVIYDQGIPDTLLPLIRERMEPITDLFPGWCESLIIFYNHDSQEGSTLACSPNYAYRFIQVIVYSGFFADPMWQESLIHEIMHGIFSPYITRVEHIINNHVLNDELKAYISNDIKDLEEAVAQDSVALMFKWKERYGQS